MQQLNTEIQAPIVPPAREIENNELENERARVHLWTRDEYYKMAEIGFFDGKRVELIEGEVFEMTPMKSPHATAVRLVIDVLKTVFTGDYVIDSQLPMSFSSINEPEPDVAVIVGKIRDFADVHPKTAALIVEVSDTTLRYDQTKKATLYAKNKIEEYWILNLKNRCLEVYRRPISDKTLGFIYAEMQIITENEAIAPLAAPGNEIKIADMLP